MTSVYFIRHAQPNYKCKEDRIRQLTADGVADAARIPEIMKGKQIDVFYCSPYIRSMDTILPLAHVYGMKIITDERLRERESGVDGNSREMFARRWADFTFHEPGGESLQIVQERNIAALSEILDKEAGKNIVIGTHGTALSTILNYYMPEFEEKDFMRFIDWMPYIIELDFGGKTFTGMKEIWHIYKEFKI